MVQTNLCCVDQFVCQTFCDALDVPEGGFPGTGAEQPDGLIDTSQRGDVNRLSTYGTGPTDTGRVFTRAAVDDGIDQHLQWVLRNAES